METKNKISDTISDRSFEVEKLMCDLKQKDCQYGGMVKRLSWVYGLLIPVYLFVFIIKPGTTNYEKMSGLFYALGLTLFFIVFRYLNKEFNYVNYGEPLIKLLHLAIKRYKKWSWPTYLALVGALFVDLGMCYSSVFDDSKVDKFKEIIDTQLFFIPSLAIATFIGYLIWRKRYKPLFDKAKELLKELE